MNDHPPPSDTRSDAPFFQRLYDSPFKLLAIGLGVMFVLFTFWGLWEVLNLPQALLP